MSPALIVVLAAVVALLAFRWFVSYRSPESLRQMHQLVDDGAVLLDVRSPGEFQTGGLRGALNIPLQNLGRRMDEITGDAKRKRRGNDRKRGVVVYCASGVRSRAAARMLRSAGCDPVHDLGPMSNWHKGGS